MFYLTLIDEYMSAAAASFCYYWTSSFRYNNKQEECCYGNVGGHKEMTEDMRKACLFLYITEIEGLHDKL